MTAAGRGARGLRPRPVGRPGKLLLAAALVLPLVAGGCRGDRQEQQAALQQADQPQSLTGLFSLEDGVTMFTPCHTRTRVPVADLGDYPALAAAYERWRTRPGEQLLVTVTGRIAVPPSGTGQAGETPALIIESFTGIWPGETCGRPGAVAALQDMYWKLTRLEGQPVAVLEHQREPHLVFHTEGRRLAGSGGCNRLQGSYELDGDRLVLGRIGTTKMMCPEAIQQEQAFLAALERVAAHRLAGQHLELLDKEGAVLLRFEERALTQ